MNKAILLSIFSLLFLLVGCGGAATVTDSTGKPGATTVEVIYLNHAPIRPAVAEIDDVLATYGDQLNVIHYDFNTPEGEAFAQAKDLTGHTPLAIFINDSMEFTVEGRDVKFYSFPEGEGTGVVPDGAWNIDDLRWVLDEITGKNV